MINIFVIQGDSFDRRPTQLWACDNAAEAVILFNAAIRREFGVLAELPNRDEWTGLDGFTLFHFKDGVLQHERSFCRYPDDRKPPEKSGFRRVDGKMVPDDRW